jgi:hypothetical protein
MKNRDEILKQVQDDGGKRSLAAVYPEHVEGLGMTDRLLFFAPV